MVSSNQTDTVKRLELEGWTIVIPSPPKLTLGGPIIMQRVTVGAAIVDRIAVIPDGETIPNE